MNLPIEGKDDDKSRVDLDHTCSEGKTHSVTDSPMKEEHSESKQLKFSKDTQEFSKILWKFMTERYVPYLELLRHCRVDEAKYGAVIRSAFSDSFSELL